jgi:hypothetical protein
MSIPNRNDPCPCGSGKKYKQCCLKRDEALAASRRAVTASIPGLLRVALGHYHAGRLAGSEDDYVAKAVELADDVACLSETRSKLRGQIESCPLRDEAGFARKVEDAYRGMWEIWCEKG